MKAEFFVSPAHKVGQTDKRLFGSFIEHIGRAVYTGIYEPGHPAADKNGFRQDVAEAIKELNVSIIRYPGGNFVSGYRWTDGIGPKEERPCRTDLAWRCTETNQCGVDDFAQYCESLGVEVCMAVNLGMAGAEEARDLVEYCNFKKGTAYSDLRIKNGREEPYGIKVWCLGNEMDADWQIGHKRAYDYACLASEASKVMKWTDPNVETVLCGSSTPDLPTFGEWELETLKVAYDHIDYISLHRYYSHKGISSEDFAAAPVDAERFITNVIALCDAEAARRKSKRKIMLSFDEWNVWNHLADRYVKDWAIAPPILEEIFTVEDAIVVGGLLITLLRHCDRVKIACMAQLVNVIAPIMTVKGGGIWKQTVFYPFRDVSNNGRGTVYDIRIDAESYETVYGEAKKVDGIVVGNEDGHTVVFAVNRSFTESAELVCDLGFVPDGGKPKHTVLTGEPSAHNSADEPENVKPYDSDDAAFDGGILTAKLPPLSWNMIVLR